MSDLGYGTETTEPATATALESGDGHLGGDGTQSTLAGEDQLPTRQDTRSTTWGGAGEFTDGTDLAGPSDAPDRFTAGEDQLPTRQAARSTTWGGDAEYSDSTELAEPSDAPGGPGAEADRPGDDGTAGYIDLGGKPETTDQLPKDRREPDEQRAVGEELARGYEQKIDQQIDQAADAVNPRFDWTKSAYSENCTGVVQAYELRRRGHDVQAGALETHLRTDEGGPGGQSLSVIENTWGGKFVPCSKGEIEEAFKQPGSRGVVYIRWDSGGAHVFNVENNGGKVRFVDGQPTPARYDASDYFGKGHGTRYLRTDDRPDPPETATKPYLES